MDTLLNTINTVRVNKGLAVRDTLLPTDRLREDMGLDSLDLAEFTVRLESITGIDVFADGLVYTVGDVAAKLGKGEDKSKS